MAGKIAARLKELKIELPASRPPAGNYVPVVRTDNLLFIAGQVSQNGTGEPKIIGKLGAGLSVEQGKQAARLCALNILSQASAALDGDLDRVKRIVRINGFVNSAPDFTDQPQVINGCSDVMVEIFGDVGKHSRVAIGAGSLPLGFAVEIDAVIEVS